MNWRFLATGILVCCFIFHTAIAEELTCGAEKTYKEGGGEEHALTLVLINNQITGLTYSNVFSNGEEGGAFACELILKDGTPESEWIRSGKKIKVIDKEPGEQSFVEIEIPANGEYKVILHAVSAYHCGLGAVFPEYVVLKKADKKCLIADSNAAKVH
jgi:hypothetical protein